MFWRRKQQHHSVTLKLAGVALLSLLTSFVEPTQAAILRVVTEPIKSRDFALSYSGLSESDLFSPALEKGADQSATQDTTTALLVQKTQASQTGDRSRGSLSIESLINSLRQLRLDSGSKEEKNTPPVPIFEQVDMANIYEGVYIFTPKNPPDDKAPEESADTENQPPDEPATTPSGPFTGLYLPQPVAVRGQAISGGGFPSVNQIKQQPGYALPSVQVQEAGNTLALANQIQQQVQRNYQQLQQQQTQLQQQIQRQQQEQQRQEEKLRQAEQKRLAETERKLMQQYQQQQQRLQQQLVQQQRQRF
jgi:hypothetical protein